MRRGLLTLSVFMMIILSWTHLQGQVSRGGIPRSFDPSKSGSLNNEVPVMKMLAVDVDALKAEDALIDPLKDRPWRFGQNLDVDLEVKRDGISDVFADGSKLYRLSIKSNNATSLNLTFDYFRIPEGSDLFIYSKDHQQILGAFTSDNNQANHIFGTTLVFADEIILEYYEPANVSYSGSLHISRVTHGYRGPGDLAKGFGTSGSCQKNAVCAESAGFEDQVRSVCMLVVGGSGFCTGALVNNTSGDGTPYVLTANHCSTSNDFSSWVFWFNWQSVTCSNPSSSPSYNSISGSALKARSSGSDFCLVQMNSTPPSNYNVYYAGWDRSGTAPTSGLAIHHPDGDIKKISPCSAMSQTSWGSPSAQVWEAPWSTTACTEPGSSGSPLFDQNHRIVGQLFGGPSACGESAANMRDYYGRFNVSWTGGGTDATRLSNWLDPSSSASTTLDGYDPNAVSVALDAKVSAITEPAGASCNGTSVTPTMTITNKGTNTLTSVTVAYKVDNGSAVTQSWTGSLASNASSTVTFPTVTMAAGSHTLKAWTSSPNGSADQNTANDTASTNFTLSAGVINSFPWTEGFENGGTIPACWSEETVTGSLNWTYTSGTGGGQPANAHSGSFDASFYEGDYGTDNVTKLITPPINLSAFSTATLTFWHVQKDWSGDQDELKVYYKTSAAGSWTQLASYTASVTSWTMETITLPSLNATYYIAFEAKENYGYGVGLDDVSINSPEGISEPDQVAVSVFPNPANDIVNVNFSASVDNAVIEFFDIQGKVVKSITVNGVSTTVRVDDLQAGIYSMRISASALNSVVRVLIK